MTQNELHENINQQLENSYNDNTEEYVTTIKQQKEAHKRN